MPSNSKTKIKLTILIALLVVFAIAMFKQYMPMLKLPTNSRIEDEEQRLKSLLGDLGVQRKMNSAWQADLAALNVKAGKFWKRAKTGSPVEQEVLDEFNNIARLASANIQSRQASLVKASNSNYVQEVELRIEMRGISMKEFTRLLKQLRDNRRKFYWHTCRIEPENVQKPTGVKVSGRLKAYILSDDGSRILAAGKELSSSGSEQKANATLAKKQPRVAKKTTKGAK